MPPIRVICAFAAMLLNVYETNGQTACVPGPVNNLTVTTTNVLTWLKPDDCIIASYVVSIRKEGDPNLLYYVTTTSLALTALEICESYDFSVTAVTSTHVQGLENIISTRTPPQGLNLTVQVMNTTQIDQDVLLSWQVKADIERCIDLYRLVIWDEDTETPIDIYVYNTTIVLEKVIPCMKYEYEIRAIIGAEEGTPLYKNFTAAGITPKSPTLSSIDQGTNTCNITWNLENSEDNRCPITALIADASPNFNRTFPVNDTLDRPPYTMTLNDLIPNTIYLCRIYVENSEGVSPPLAIALQTLPDNSTVRQHHRQELQLHQHKYRIVK